MTEQESAIERIRQRLLVSDYAGRHEFLFLKSPDLLRAIAEGWQETPFHEKSFYLRQMSREDVEVLRTHLGDEVVSHERVEVRRLIELSEVGLTPIRRMYTRSARAQFRSSEETERAAISLAIAESGDCVGEDGEVRPKVGAVVYTETEILGAAHRGQHEPGQHAEYGLLEYMKAHAVDVAGARLVTTLEPCTTRSHDKYPCAGHIARWGIGRVVIGSLDPNPGICGRGVLYLQARGIDVELVPAELYKSVADVNRRFLDDKLQAYKVDLMKVVGDTT